MTYFFGIIAFIAIGAYVGFIVFQHKNRDPMTGAVLGSISGIFLVPLVLLVAVVMLLPALKPDDQGYVSRKKLGSDIRVTVDPEPDDEDDSGEPQQ